MDNFRAGQNLCQRTSTSQVTIIHSERPIATHGSVCCKPLLVEPKKFVFFFLFFLEKGRLYFKVRRNSKLTIGRSFKRPEIPQPGYSHNKYLTMNSHFLRSLSLFRAQRHVKRNGCCPFRYLYFITSSREYTLIISCSALESVLK